HLAQASVSTGETILTSTNRFGETTATLLGIQTDATTLLEQIASDGDTAIANTGYDFSLGAFAAGKVVVNANQALHHNDIYYRTTAALPYTITGATPEADPASWLAISLQPLQQVARSLNISDNTVILDTDTATPIPAYIYSASQQKTYSVPSGAQGQTIVSVVGRELETNISSPATYTLKLVSTVNMTEANVEDFGALPGIDCTEAFQKCSDYMLENNIATMYFPNVGYHVSDSIHFGVWSIDTNNNVLGW
ncbi:unnamed protein product, partial [marine sediment metagenome]